MPDRGVGRRGGGRAGARGSARDRVRRDRRRGDLRRAPAHPASRVRSGGARGRGPGVRGRHRARAGSRDRLRVGARDEPVPQLGLAACATHRLAPRRTASRTGPRRALGAHRPHAAPRARDARGGLRRGPSRRPARDRRHRGRLHEAALRAARPRGGAGPFRRPSRARASEGACGVAGGTPGRSRGGGRARRARHRVRAGGSRARRHGRHATPRVGARRAHGVPSHARATSVVASASSHRGGGADGLGSDRGARRPRRRSTPVVDACGRRRVRRRRRESARGACVVGRMLARRTRRSQRVRRGARAGTDARGRPCRAGHRGLPVRTRLAARGGARGLGRRRDGASGEDRRR